MALMDILACVWMVLQTMGRVALLCILFGLIFEGLQNLWDYLHKEKDNERRR